jgi:hypothetical protein
MWRNEPRIPKADRIRREFLSKMKGKRVEEIVNSGVTGQI